MTPRHASVCLLAVCILTFAAASAQEVNAGARLLAQPCAGCHRDSNATAGMVPTLDRQSGRQLLQALREFKSGTRPATVMQRIARGYRDEELERISTYLGNRAEQ